MKPEPPGEESRVVSPGEAADLSNTRFSVADVAFMQGMISRDVQAPEMTKLVSPPTLK